VYAQASEFAGDVTNKDEFDSAVAEQKLDKRVASARENDRMIPGLENARVLVRAAYDAEIGDLLQDPQGSTIFDLGDNFVIATLVSATEEGIADFESVRARVELAVLKEKKAEFLMDKAKAAMKGKTDLEAIATELETTVKNATNISFNSLQIPGVGLEPKVISTATTLEPNQISKPESGNNGIFLVKVTSVTQGEDQDVESEKLRLAQNLSFRASSQAYNVHREKAEIEDKRAKFY
jgi:peptidyl-prolyl cis-trans isomerase D